MVDCEKYSPGSGPQWQIDKTQFLALYKVLLKEPDGASEKHVWDSRTRVLCRHTKVKRVGSALSVKD